MTDEQPFEFLFWKYFTFNPSISLRSNAVVIEPWESELGSGEEDGLAFDLDDGKRRPGFVAFSLSSLADSRLNVSDEVKMAFDRLKSERTEIERLKEKQTKESPNAPVDHNLQLNSRAAAVVIEQRSKFQKTQ